MFKMIRYALTTTLLIGALTIFGVIEFTEKGRQTLHSVKDHIMTMIDQQIAGRDKL